MAQNKKFAIGVDYGTNSVRALSVDLTDGSEVGTSVYNYPSGDAGILLNPADPMTARQSPRDYVNGFNTSVAEAVRMASETLGFSIDSVVGIGVDTTGSTPIPVDADGTPLAFKPEFADNLAAQAWLWKDHTSIEEAAEITRLAREKHPEYLVKCGGIYSSEWWWAKIWHCKKEAPEVFAAAYSWIELADFIPAYASGNMKPEKAARGVCAAGHKAMWNADWGGFPARDFLAALDPDLAALCDRLPANTQTADKIAGYLTEEVAKIVGLRPGTPIAVGAFDCHMGAVGSGVQPGSLVKIVGTSCCDITVLPLEANLGELPGVCGVVPGSVLPDAFGIEAGQSAVGDIFNWFAKNLAPASYSENGNVFVNLEKEASKLSPGESGLVALDWNNGNRCILVDQALTGVIMGNTLHTTAAETYRALVEATAYGAFRIVERLEEYGVDVKEIIVCGGVAEKSPMTMQIFADVCNRPLKIARSSQTCALGAAIFGAVAGGAFANVAEARRAIVGYKDLTYTPNPESVAVYAKLYAVYKTLHDAFGVEGAGGDVYRAMKDLIKIRDEVRAAK
ncbi:MAG: ribulokinase [Thermoguttaceae bacterium]|nr:ribulokinase [Thermoguttaceae bacterium]